MDYHDALAELGVGSAHPGGYLATLRALEKMNLKPGMRVVEIGCGTGRTACELVSRYQVSVTAADLRPSMLAKAQLRAQAMGVAIDFVRVVGKRLPFPDQQFDLLVAESVTVFNQIPRLLKEYARVLKPEGRVLDIEMCGAAVLPDDVLRAFADTYGARMVPTMKEWKRLYVEAGFAEVQILESGSVTAGPLGDDVPDLWSMAQGSNPSKEVWDVVERNQDVMTSFHQWLRYAVIDATKSV